MKTITQGGTIVLLNRLDGRRSLPYAVMALLTALLISGAAFAYAQNNQRQSNEQELKAGFLTLFPQYIAWPSTTELATDTTLAASTPPSNSAKSSESTRPIMICVLGSDPFGALLDQYALGRKGGKPLSVKRLDTPDDSAQCQVVFIAKTETRHEAVWLAALKGKPVLTVGESGKTIARGGAIEFKQVGQRIRFEVNLVAVKSAHLTISSAMLSHASEVYRAPPTPQSSP